MFDSLITFDSHLPLCHFRHPDDGRHAYGEGNKVLLQTILLLKQFFGQQDRRCRKIKCQVVRISPKLTSSYGSHAPRHCH